MPNNNYTDIVKICCYVDDNYKFFGESFYENAIGLDDCYIIEDIY